MRTARDTPPDEVHHVISRFIEKRFFITTDAEREHYLALLAKSLKQTDWLCLAYAVMSSHIHLAMIAGHKPAESWSRRVNGPFAGWYNHFHERVGPLFAGRATMRVERTQNVARLIAYIHNNPVRAKVVRTAGATSWTSHRAYVDSNQSRPWLSVDRGLERAGLGREEFDEWVSSERWRRRKDMSLEEIDHEARRLGAIVLGTPKLEPLEVPLLSRPFGHVRPNPGRIVEVVCEVLGTAADDILQRARGPGAVARAVAVQAGAVFGVSLTASGDAVGITPQAASKLAVRQLDTASQEALRVVCRRLEAELSIGLRKYKASPPKLLRTLETDG